MSTELALTRPNELAAIVGLVTDSVTSAHSKRAYDRALREFLAWVDAAGRPGFSKATVNTYRAALLEAGKSAAAVNQAMSAIRKLANEAADNGLIEPTAAAAVGRVKGVEAAGRRSGNWLSRDQAQRLLDAPNTATLKGLRDRALLAVLLGTGLRRAEVAGLTYEHIRQRDGRWVIVDLIGKRGRVRSVPMPSWTKAAIDAWSLAAGRSTGRVFVSINKGDRIDGDSMSPQAVYETVDHWAAVAGLEVAAHDLRRTFAKLAHKGGAALDQIQLTLGHSSLQTTERYLGVEQNLESAPCDVLGLSLYR